MMERTNAIHLPRVPRSPTPKRPYTEQGPQFRNIPARKESTNCIWITQDILNEFRSHVVKSSQVTIRFNAIKAKPKNITLSARKLPPLFAERLRMLNDRAHTNMDLKENVRRRPVKVIVDDITQLYYGKERSSHLSKKTKSKSHVGSQVSDFGPMRSMDSVDDGDFPHDIIDTVARANSVHTETTQVLPEIRAAPCPLHVKQDKIGKGKGHEPTLSTNSHFRDLKGSRYQQHPIKNISIQNHSSSHEHHHHGHAKNNRMDINVKLPEQFPSSRAPVLPKNMSSKDYVVTWLIHGSEPSGSNHFPEIIPNNSKRKSMTTPRKSHVSE